MTSASEPEPEGPEAGRGFLDWLNARNGLWSAMQAIALIVAGGWAIILLGIDDHNRRVDLAMGQAAGFVEGRPGDARRLLDRLWYSIPAEVMELFRGALARLPAEEARNQAIRKFVADYILPGDEQADPVDVQLAIADVAAQLDLIATCAGTGGGRSWFADHFLPPRCHRATTEVYFCGYTKSFHTLYGGVLEDIRRTTGNRALGSASLDFAKGQGCGG